MISAAEIVGDPNWYLHSIDLNKLCFSFVKTDSSSLSACSFLDHRFEAKSLSKASLSIDDLLPHLELIDAAPPRFVFHTAFCCSTLLARCLDFSSLNISLKEPAVLMELANYKRTNHPQLNDEEQARVIYLLVTRLLFRPFGEGQSVLVKPTNTVNNIISPLMQTHAESKALLLHSDLDSFLISILKKGEQGRSFVRRLFTIFQMDSPEALQLEANQLVRMTDSQIAAITWHLQLEKYFDVLEASDKNMVRTLHCDRLLSSFEELLMRVVEFFEMVDLKANFNQLMEQAPLRENAKTPSDSFNATDRKHEYSQAQKQFSESLEIVKPWAQQLRFKHAYSDEIDFQL